MLKSYFISALRNLINSPAYSAINIFGLSLGLACCVTMLIFLTYQLSFDTQFKDFERIHLLQTTIEFQRGNESTSKTISTRNFELIRDNLADIEASASLERTQITIKRDLDFTETAFYTQSDFFHIFNFRFIEGNRKTALDKPSAVVLTNSIARKYFGHNPALGEMLPVNDKLLTVTGVIEDLPVNTHLKNMGLGIFISSKSKPENSAKINQFADFDLNGYVKLRRGTPLATLEQQIQAILPEQQPGEYDNLIVLDDDSPQETRRGRGQALPGNQKRSVSLLPIQNSHLEGEKSISIGYGGLTGDSLYQSWFFIYTAGGLALAVLIISCINFINLTTAKFTQRNREIGLRKVLGAGKQDIFGQFISESFVFTVVAVLLALAISHFTLPWFGQLVQTDLTSINYATPFFALAIAILVIATTLLAGFYPSMMLSRVNPVAALSQAGTSSTRSRLRKVLTVCQFSFSILLITVCMTLYYQVNHLKNLDLGFKLDNIALVQGMAWGQGGASKAEILRRELLAQSSIQSISTPIFSMGQGETEYKLSGSNTDPVKLSNINADYDFLDHYQIKLTAGKPFTRGLSTQVTSIPMMQEPKKDGAIILTQTGMEKLGLRSAKAVVGKKLLVVNDNSKVQLEIIGVTNAFPKILENQNIPLGGDFIALTEDPAFMVSVRIREGQHAIGKEQINRVMDNVFPNQVTTPQFPQQILDTIFSTMTRALSCVILFAVIAIIIAMLGLYAMSTFVVERRTREIGIRKAIGASVTRITTLLLWDFSKPVLIALALATPLAYLGANFIIQHIAARIPLELITFGIVPLLTVTIAMITVSSHTIRAANTNPVRALRYE